MKSTIRYTICLLLLAGLWSCEKFPEGGSKKKAEANLTNIWVIDVYFHNGVDKTANLLISDFEETFADNGTYTRIYRDKDNAEVTELGTWTMDAENDEVKFTGAGPVDLTSDVTGVTTSSYSVLKLTRSKFWFVFDSGGDSHSFRMIPKE